MYTLFDDTTPDWPAHVDAIWARFGTLDQAGLFPLQFLKATFPALGGKMIVADTGAGIEAVGFLFPRDIHHGRRSYTLRYHPIAQVAASPVDELVAAVQHALDADIVPYDLAAPHQYRASHYDAGSCDIGMPDAAEAARIPSVQQAIWGAGAGFLYPADLHAVDFRPGTSLIARVEGQIAGVLFGFYRFGSVEKSDWWGDHRADLRIESQILGIAPQFRRLGLGFLLKQRQRALALEGGIDIIHWTVDPLQYPNALLNFVKLGAVAFDFYPNYYPFRNALNQVAASRFRLTWPLRAPRVARHMAAGGRERARTLDAFPGVLVLSEGALLDTLPNAPYVAIEIPGDWTALQTNDLERASRWRATTDALFSRLIGIEPGKYVIIDASANGERRYLIGRRCEGVAVLFEDQ